MLMISNDCLMMEPLGCGHKALLIGCFYFQRTSAILSAHNPQVFAGRQHVHELPMDTDAFLPLDYAPQMHIHWIANPIVPPPISLSGGTASWSSAYAAGAANTKSPSMATRARSSS